MTAVDSGLSRGINNVKTGKQVRMIGPQPKNLRLVGWDLSLSQSNTGSYCLIFKEFLSGVMKSFINMLLYNIRGLIIPIKLDTSKLLK